MLGGSKGALLTSAVCSFDFGHFRDVSRRIAFDQYHLSRLISRIFISLDILCSANCFHRWYSMIYVQSSLRCATLCCTHVIKPVRIGSYLPLCALLALHTPLPDKPLYNHPSPVTLLSQSRLTDRRSARISHGHPSLRYVPSLRCERHTSSHSTAHLHTIEC